LSTSAKLDGAKSAKNGAKMVFIEVAAVAMVSPETYSRAMASPKPTEPSESSAMTIKFSETDRWAVEWRNGLRKGILRERTSRDFKLAAIDYLLPERAAVVKRRKKRQNSSRRKEVE
jgi:hypothetical protein